MLTSAARETLAGVETVIVDEIHAVAATKRGAHLALSPRAAGCAAAEARLQRIGLSATVRPLEEVARFLGGRAPVEIVQPPIEKTFDLRVVVPVEDMTELGVAATEPIAPDSASPRRPACRAPARSGRTSTRRSSTRCCDTARRSCSRTRGGWPSG